MMYDIQYLRMCQNPKFKKVTIEISPNILGHSLLQYLIYICYDIDSPSVLCLF